jgi:hypothetical protein
MSFRAVLALEENHSVMLSFIENNGIESELLDFGAKVIELLQHFVSVRL